MDSALHNAGMTLMLDRAGITGADGASHNGMWDLAMCTSMPHVSMAAPRDGTRLKELFAQALDINDHPTILRYPKGSLPEDITALRSIPAGDILYEKISSKNTKKIAIIPVGPMAHSAIEAAHNIDCSLSVLDMRWVLPISSNVIEWLKSFDACLTIEDGVRDGGVGNLLMQKLHENDIHIPMMNLGIQKDFLPTATRENLLQQNHMLPADIIENAYRLINS
ncbi:MAG: hypothetical protein J6M18_00265 [Actinomycetaceae bacterium]|nr:hypothetical protein [Actinomycetaceae bacterium]